MVLSWTEGVLQSRLGACGSLLRLRFGKTHFFRPLSRKVLLLIFEFVWLYCNRFRNVNSKRRYYLYRLVFDLPTVLEKNFGNLLRTGLRNTSKFRIALNEQWHRLPRPVTSLFP